MSEHYIDPAFVSTDEAASDFTNELEGILTGVRILRRATQTGLRAQLEVTLDNGQRGIVCCNRDTADAIGALGGVNYTFPLKVGLPFAMRTVFVPVFDAKTGVLRDEKRYLMPRTSLTAAHGAEALAAEVNLDSTPTLEEYLASNYNGKPPVVVAAEDLAGDMPF